LMAEVWDSETASWTKVSWDKLDDHIGKGKIFQGRESGRECMTRARGELERAGYVPPRPGQGKALFGADHYTHQQPLPDHKSAQRILDAIDRGLNRGQPVLVAVDLGYHSQGRLHQHGLAEKNQDRQSDHWLNILGRRWELTSNATYRLVYYGYDNLGAKREFYLDPRTLHLWHEHSRGHVVVTNLFTADLKRSVLH
jgi:hypothetical protein